MYIANHYVNADGRKYMPGEAIPHIPEENLEWLLSVGAIRIVEDNIKECAEKSEEIAETTEDDDVPEIDVMDGIVIDSEPEPKKKSNRRKKES